MLQTLPGIPSLLHTFVSSAQHTLSHITYKQSKTGPSTQPCGLQLAINLCPEGTHLQLETDIYPLTNCIST